MTLASPSLKSTSPFLARKLCAIGALLMMLVLASIARSAPEDTSGGPVAVCDGENLWFFQAWGVSENSRIIVLHHGSGHAAEEAEQASVVEDMPEAALAVDGRLYCVFRGRRDPAGGFQNRSVSTVRAVGFNPSSRSWVYEPSPRARTVADLPGAGRIGGLVADGRDPLVLIVANPLSVEAEATGRGGAPADSGADGSDSLPKLFRLTLDNRWEELALPDELRGPHHLALIGGARPMLLASPIDSPQDASTGYVLGTDGAWSASSVNLDANRVFDSAEHDGQTYVAVKSEGGDAIGIYLLRLPQAYPIIQIEHPTRLTRLISFGASLALAESSPERDHLIITPIDVEQGTIEAPLELRRQLRPAFEDFSLLVLVGALLFASLIMFIFRPADPTRMTVALPSGSRIAEPRRRIVALLIDLLPAALLSGLILEAPIAQIFDLTRMPMRAHHLSESWPMLLMFLVCVGHCTLSELLWGRTLGKALLDCWVVGIDGKRARVMSILVRNAMKFVALCVPLLFLFVYINQYRQRLGDLAARTVVITHGESVEASDASMDRDA